MILAWLLLLGPVAVLIQVVSFQLFPERMAALMEYSKRYESYLLPITPTRGHIYDSRGHPLTGNIKVYEVGIELNNVKNPRTIAETANILLGVKYEDALRWASLKYVPNEQVYATLARSITQEQIDKLEIMIQRTRDLYGASQDPNAPSLRGLVYQPYLTRTYPENSLASNIIGFVNEEGRGYGIESYYQKLLAGQARKIWVSNDPKQVTNIPVAPSGASLVLTIDRHIQRVMEDMIQEAVDESGSTAGTVVIINPKNGEIIAMASSRRMNLNEYWRFKEFFPDPIPFDSAISATYEPGSVFKVLTMAAALDAGVVTPETTFLDQGVIDAYGTLIYNWDMQAYGMQTMQGCMQYSLNVCLAWVAMTMGKDRFYPYMEAFNFGRLTGIGLTGEAPGRLKTPGDGDWYPVDIATNSFGQAIEVTPLQMAVAISALANEGRMMAPMIVRSIIDNGYQYNLEHKVLGNPIKPETARYLSEMLARSLENEASSALVPGYRVAGKTGTGQIAVRGGYHSNETNASFVGWGPVDDPQFLVYLWLERPKTSIWSSVVASPVFRQIVEKLVVLLDLPPDEVRWQLNGQVDKR
jgi:cell division protein FtsI/penicillin-binding protein 2